jgi:hypothetical protein
MPTASQNKTARIVSWILQVALAAAFLVMGALPKLTGDPMSVALFEKLGFPAGMYVVGAFEALAAVLLLAPKTHALGGLLGVGLMLGAIASHFGPLGIRTELTVDGETSANPALFFMAILFLALSALVVGLRRDELPVVGERFVSAPAPA